MNEIDSSLFLMVNATAATPTWALSLARASSLELPRAVLAGMLGAAFFMDASQRQSLLAVLVTMLIAWICARGIQHAFPMHRPFALGIGIAWLERAPTAGFPSTHSTVAFALAVAVGLRSRRLAVTGAALALAALVAWSRLCLGMHFPSQAVAGAVLGSASAWAVYRGSQIVVTNRRRTSPTALHGQQFTPRGVIPPGRS